MPKLTMRDGHKVHVRMLGKGAPVMLLHGFGMQSSHWLPFALPLSLRHQVIIPDLRGFGKSHCTPFNKECVISNFVEDVDDIAKQLDLETFKLAGISMGALTGLKFTCTHPERVSHYMHIDQAPRCTNKDDWSWGLFGEENQERMERGRQLIQKLEPYAKLNTPFKHLPQDITQMLWHELGEFFASALSSPAQKALARKVSRVPNLMTRILPTQNWPAYIHCLKAYMQQEYDLIEQLPKLQTPVSVVVGMKSDMYPCGGQVRMADHLPNCDLLPFTRSGHAPLIDQPIKLLKELHRFART